MLARGVGPDTPSHQLALLAITRMARNDPAMAAATFSSVAPSLTPPERAIGWGTIAYQAALEADAGRGGLVSAVGECAAVEPGVRMAHAQRAARRRLDHGALVGRTDAGGAAQSAGVGLLARARAEAGRRHRHGRRRNSSRSRDRYNFYGQLALEELGQKITVPPNTTVTDAEIAQAGGAGFRAVADVSTR